MHQTVSLSGGYEFDLLLADEGGAFRGIGEVRARSLPLRSAAVPWTVLTQSETGWQFGRWQLRDLREAAGGFDLILTAAGEWNPLSPSFDALGEQRLVARSTSVPQARLVWSFRPWRQEIGDESFDGFTHQIQLETPGASVHWLLEAATWELGGSATGATLIQQDLSLMDMEQAVTRDSAFTTAEAFVGGPWAGSYPMDMLPRGGGSSICDFQATDTEALCIYAEDPGLTRARIDKRAGEDVIHYTDHVFFESGESAQLPIRTFALHRHATPLARHERRNLWLDCFIHVRSKIHQVYGFQLETPRPVVHAHLWDSDLRQYGNSWHLPLSASMREYASHGFTEVFTFAPYRSPADDDEPTGGNICCPRDYRLSDRYGSDAVMRDVVTTAEAAGIDIYQWVAFHLASNSDVWREHPDWALKQLNGKPWDGGYGCLWAGHVDSGFGDWLEGRIGDLRQKSGLPGIFWDSYQNLGLNGVPWHTPRRVPEARSIWQMQTRLQRAGFRQRIECLGIFGVSQISLFGFDDTTARRRLWQDAVEKDWAFALFDTSPGFFGDGDAFAPDRVSAEHYFRLAAHRCLPIVTADPWHSSKLGGLGITGDISAYARTNHLFNRVSHLMHRPRLLPDGAGVLWLDAQGKPGCLWALADGVHEIQHRADCLETSESLGDDGCLRAVAGRVYVFKHHPPKVSVTLRSKHARKATPVASGK